MDEEKYESNEHKLFNKIYDKYSNQLMIYCRKLTKDDDNADDIFQLTWLSLFSIILDNPNKLEKINNIKSYLFKAAYNNFIKHINIEKKKRILSIEGFKSYSFIKNEFEDTLFIDCFLNAIESLELKTKDILIKVCLQGFSISEIALQNNESYDCIRMRYSRGLKKIEQELKPIE